MSNYLNNLEKYYYKLLEDKFYLKFYKKNNTVNDMHEYILYYSDIINDGVEDTDIIWLTINQIKQINLFYNIDCDNFDEIIFIRYKNSIMKTISIFKTINVSYLCNTLYSEIYKTMKITNKSPDLYTSISIKLLIEYFEKFLILNKKKISNINNINKWSAKLNKTVKHNIINFEFLDVEKYSNSYIQSTTKPNVEMINDCELKNNYVLINDVWSKSNTIISDNPEVNMYDVQPTDVLIKSLNKFHKTGCVVNYSVLNDWLDVLEYLTTSSKHYYNFGTTNYIRSLNENITYDEYKKNMLITNDDEKKLLDKHKILSNDILLMYCYKNIKFYHKYTVDFRGRCYISSSLSPMANKITRSILEFENNHPDNLNIDEIRLNIIFAYMISVYGSEKCNSKEKALILWNEFNVKNHSLDSVKDIYNFIKYKNVINESNYANSTIHLDATASVLQILAVLTRDENLMIKTNVLSNSDNVIKDPYIEIIKDNPNNLNNIINKYIKNTNINLNDVLSLNIRKNLKTIIMTYIYGSNVRTITKKLSNSSNFKIMFIYVKSVIEILKKMFPIMFELIDVIKYLAKIEIKYNGKNTIKTDSMIIKHCYYKKNEKRITINMNKLNIKNKDKFTVDITTINIHEKYPIKTGNSIMANGVQGLDGNMLHNMNINTLYSILAAHDCFTVNTYNMDDLIKKYNNELYNIYMNGIEKVFIINKNLNITNKKDLKKYNIYINKYNTLITNIKNINVNTNNMLNSEYSLIP